MHPQPCPRHALHGERVSEQGGLAALLENLDDSRDDDADKIFCEPSYTLPLFIIVLHSKSSCEFVNTSGEVRYVGNAMVTKCPINASKSILTDTKGIYAYLLEKAEDMLTCVSRY